MAMNWSYFKPEFSGKLEEDPEVHIHRMIDWVDTYNFASVQRVLRFSLTQAGQARLWYQLTYPIQGNWMNYGRHLGLSFLR